MSNGGSATISIGPAGLRLVDGARSEDLPLICGAVHFFDLDPAHWERCLDSVVELGLTMVDVCVPWSVHEVAPGSFDFTSDRLNVSAFLALCDARGLKVLLRPGPQVNGQLTGFGFPSRILSDPALHARCGRGNVAVFSGVPQAFPLPSYASERFLGEAEVWLRGVAAAVEHAVWPDGPIVAVRIDNELSFGYRTGAYDQDYHPDAVAFYLNYLQETYGEQLPAGYDGWTREPPRKMDARSAAELTVHLDWLAAKEAMVTAALTRLGRALADRSALGRALALHNLPTSAAGEPCSISAAEGAVDIAGFEFYPRGRAYRAARQASLLLGASRLPTLLGACWGGWPWWFPQQVEDQLANALAALMHGVRGINLQMVVERDRWYGAPIHADGSRDEDRFEVTRRFITAFKEVTTFKRPVEVAVLRVRDYRRLAVASSLIDPVTPMLANVFGVSMADLASDETFELSCAVQRAAQYFIEQVEQALTEQGIAYHLVDDDAPLQTLRKYRALILPSFDFIDQRVLARLGGYVAAGGQLLLGPALPLFDRTFEPLSEPLPQHVKLTEEMLDDDLADLLGVAPPTVAGDGRVEVVAYQNDSGSDVALFVANQDALSRTICLDPDPQQVALWDALSGVPVTVECINLDALQVRMLRRRRRPS